MLLELLEAPLNNIRVVSGDLRVLRMTLGVAEGFLRLLFGFGSVCGDCGFSFRVASCLFSVLRGIVGGDVGTKIYSHFYCLELSYDYS